MCQIIKQAGVFWVYGWVVETGPELAQTGDSLVPLDELPEMAGGGAGGGVAGAGPLDQGGKCAAGPGRPAVPGRSESSQWGGPGRWAGSPSLH